jgi:hypothetical protein
MLIGTKVTIGPFVPDDYAAMYCWANDVAAARLDGAFRPVNLTEVVRMCESAATDPTRVMFAVRPRGSARKEIAAGASGRRPWRWRSTIAGGISISTGSG